MAQGARDLTMVTEQGEIRVIVIECYGLPLVFVMTVLTGLLHALVWHDLRPSLLNCREK